MTGLFDNALARLKEREGAPLIPALTEALKLLRDRHTSWVNVVYTSTTTFDSLDLSKLPPDLRGTVLHPKEAFTASTNKTREHQISRALEAAFDNLLGPGVIAVNDYGTKTTPVTFTVSYQVGLTGALYESVKESRYGGAAKTVDKRFMGIGFAWDFGVNLAGEKDARYTFQLHSEPAKDIRWQTHSYGGVAYESPTLPYDKMAECAFDDFKAQLAVRFGDKNAHPRDRSAERDQDELSAERARTTRRSRPRSRPPVAVR